MTKDEIHSQHSRSLTPSEIYRMQWLDKEHHLSPSEIYRKQWLDKEQHFAPPPPGVSESLNRTLQRISMQTKDVALQEAILLFQLNCDQEEYLSETIMFQPPTRDKANSTYPEVQGTLHSEFCP
jgi:hypothetical protein